MTTKTVVVLIIGLDYISIWLSDHVSGNFILHFHFGSMGL